MEDVRCPKCKYRWITKSKHVKVNCPSCMIKIKISDCIVKKKEQKE